jgi:hypothetical protein
VLLAAYDARRPTRDIDLQAEGLRNDIDTVLRLVREIAALPREDGLVYDHEAAAAQTIRDDEEYSGVRVSMVCALASARISLHVDVSVGDPIHPAPRAVEVPRLLGGNIIVRGYPLPMVLAEKIVTAVERGTANTRWRDFADVYLLSKRHAVPADELLQAMRAVARHRQVVLAPLTTVLAGFADIAKTRWTAWVRKQRLSDRLPDALADVLLEVLAFADPILLGTARGRWDSMTRTWRET